MVTLEKLLMTFGDHGTCFEFFLHHFLSFSLIKITYKLFFALTELLYGCTVVIK